MKSDFIGIALNPGEDLKTEADAAVFFPPVASENIAVNRGDLSIDETLGNRSPSAREYGGRVFEGDIAGAARANSLGVLLSMFFGEPDTTEVLAPVTGPPAVPGVYTHVWNPTAANKRPLPGTVWTVNDNPVDQELIVDQYVGVKGNQLQFELATDGYLMFTAGVAAWKLFPDVTAPTANRDATKKFAFHQVGAQIAVRNPDGTWPALATVPLLAYGLTYNNNLVTDQLVIGSLEVDSIPEGNIEAEATFTPAAELKSHYRRALLDTPEDVRLKLTAVGPVITGTNHFGLSIDLKRLQYTEAPIDIDAGETLRGVEVTAAPVLDEATGGLLEISLTNDQDGSDYVAP